jgi:hypothetical protein
MQTGARNTAYMHIAFWSEGMVLYIKILMPDNHESENYILFIDID